MREKLISFILILVVFCSGLGIMTISNKLKKDSKVVIQDGDKTIITENRHINITDNGISEAVADCYDTVVMIKNYQNKKYGGSGSGFVYKTDSKYGYIYTNYHVIEKATDLKVKFTNGKEVEGKLLGGDKYLDLAVVRVDKSNVIKVAKIGKANNLKLGETIFAIGSPMGEEYFNTVTRGVVSGLNRKVTVSVQTNDDWVMKALQVDAAINPGNSGGPLFNSKGEVVGINSMKLVDSTIEGMGFSIMIEDAINNAKVFESGKEIQRPVLGISLVNATEKTTLYKYGITLDTGIDEGIVVIDVASNSGASKSDLKKGDVIIKIDNENIPNQAYLKYVLYSYKVGDNVKITYLRNGKQYTTKVTLTK